MEEVTNKVDKKLKNKQKTRKIKRGILVVLNAALACYFVYSVAGAITSYCERINNTDPSSFITINELNKNESLEVYKKAIKYDENTDTFNVKEVVSYSYYGGYLHFKDNNDLLKNDDTLNFSSYTKYILRNLSDNREYEKRFEYSVFSYLNSGIPLFSSDLKEGSYIVYPDNYEESTPIKISSVSGIYETIYSPSKNGVRRKIEIRSNAISPCLVINIKDVLQLPYEYNDIAVLTSDENKETIKNVLNNKDYKISYISKTNEKQDIIGLYQSNASVSLIIDEGDDIVVSSYLNIENVEKSSRIADGNLKGLDDDVYIRELGGDVFASGKGYSSDNDSNKWLSPYIDSINNGSLVIRVGIDKATEINNILEILNF